MLICQIYIQKMKMKGIELELFSLSTLNLIELISGDKDCDACFSGTGKYKRLIFDMKLACKRIPNHVLHHII